MPATQSYIKVSLFVSLALMGGLIGSIASADTAAPASRCVTAAMKALRAKTEAGAVAQAKAVPITTASPAALQQAYHNYQQGLAIAWAAIEAPYCGFDTSHKAGTPQHSYEKTAAHLQTAFALAVSNFRHGLPITNANLPALASTSGTVPDLTSQAQQAVEAARIAKTVKTVNTALKTTVATATTSTHKKLTVLSFGMRGALVTYVQQLLAKDSTLYPEGYVSGYFGPATEKAVIRFQQKEGLLTGGWSGGIVGRQTMAKLEKVFRQR